MAKQKQSTDLAVDVAADDVAASSDDVALAVRAVQDITGCGKPAAEARVAKMGGKRVAQIAELERKDQRAKIVTLLYS